MATLDARRAATAEAPAGPDKSPERIAGMFDRIARRYDLLNHLLSGGLDLYWRARAIRALRLAGGERVLDVCTGTADVMLAALKGRPHPARFVVGVDFAHQMLRIGQRKLREAGVAPIAPLVRGDAMRLPVRAGTMDAATIAFGIRNVCEPREALADILRALRPGGRLAVLEFAMPRTPLLRSLYTWYFRNVLPRIGAVVSRHDEAYRYLPESVGTFYEPEEFSSLLREAGFTCVTATALTFGVVHLYLAEKGEGSPAVSG
jgi:demethylmenaquinone methyltransferase/2-methoxy-6-polyprenyl-1,4-benzoquinol methylase